MFIVNVIIYNNIITKLNNKRNYFQENEVR